MNYWMFTVLYESFPKLWPTMVDWGVAAQQYPVDWVGEPRNWKALRGLKKGDGIIAAFLNHRFAGYGFLETDFRRGGEAMRIDRRIPDGDPLEFQERANVAWTVLPYHGNTPFIDCRDLKMEGFTTTLDRGSCVKQIDLRTFTKIRERLDEAGAVAVPPVRDIRESATSPLYPQATTSSGKFFEGAERFNIVTRYERDPRVRPKCIEAHGTTCSICGFSFEATYGPDAKGYIHVHHLKPISIRGGKHVVDPVEDLRPVCPNCHAVLHLGGQCRSIDEVRKLLEKRKGN